MTFHAKAKEGQPSTAEVHTTYGPIRIVVDEHIGHLRSFHGDLGRLLDRMEAELRQPEAETAGE